MGVRRSHLAIAQMAVEVPVTADAKDLGKMRRLVKEAILKAATEPRLLSYHYTADSRFDAFCEAVAERLKQAMKERMSGNYNGHGRIVEAVLADLEGR